jgi:hypothetical protein
LAVKPVADVGVRSGRGAVSEKAAKLWLWVAVAKQSYDLLTKGEKGVCWR